MLMSRALVYIEEEMLKCADFIHPFIDYYVYVFKSVGQNISGFTSFSSFSNLHFLLFLMVGWCILAVLLVGDKHK